MSAEVLMLKIVLLPNMTLCRLLVAVRLFLLHFVCEFGTDSAKSTV